MNLREISLSHIVMPFLRRWREGEVKSAITPQRQIARAPWIALRAWELAWSGRAETVMQAL